MQTLIFVLQVMCVAGLSLGTVLSLCQLIQGCDEEERPSYAVANDFETGFRRLARIRR